MRVLVIAALATCAAAATRPAIVGRSTGVLARDVEKPTVTKALALRGGADLTPETFCTMMTVVYGGFGVFLGTLGVDVCFGPNSPVSYFTECGDCGVWFARMLGATMTLLFSSPMWAGVSAAALAKAMLPLNVYYLINFIYAAAFCETTKDSKNAVLPFNLWWTQVAIGAGLLVANKMVIA
jgi:hypothetical protein